MERNLKLDQLERLFWKNSMNLKIICVIILVFILLIVFYEFADRNIGSYTIEKSASQTPAFNYILSGYDKNNFYSMESFVNDYIITDGYLYYTHISAGAGLDGWCYLDDRLMLSRINIEENIIERDINLDNYSHIYQKISSIHDQDEKWLSDTNNKCE